MSISNELRELSAATVDKKMVAKIVARIVMDCKAEAAAGKFEYQHPIASWLGLSHKMDAFTSAVIADLTEQGLVAQVYAEQRRVAMVSVLEVKW